jgi:hypothetical protein
MRKNKKFKKERGETLFFLSSILLLQKKIGIQEAKVM